MAAQGSIQPATNGAIPNGTSDHSRKPSVVISASGATGYTPNGGPVGQTGRPPINFGMMGAQQPQDQSTSSLATPADNPRVISPTHSPSPIPQPATTSGGRPPSSLQSQGNGPAFGSIAADSPGQAQFSPAHIHERRPSSQSMQSGDSNMGRNYGPPQAGRGRGFPQQYGQGSPAMAFRQPSNPGRPGMNPQFSSGNLPPNAQFGRPPNRQQSPAINHVQPQMGYGYSNQQMYMQQGYDPYSGYYQPYQYQAQFGSPGPSGSPRPQYPNPYAGSSGPGQPPFMPPNMARTPSQASDRPGSSIGHPGTPSQSHVLPQPPHMSGSAQAPSSNFVRPVKKSNAIKITNEKGETINFGKPAAAAAAAAVPAATTTSAPQTSSTPVIAHTPSAPTPPPRTPSSQHVRAESKATLSQDETREAFKRQVEEKRRQEEAANKPAAATEVVEEAAAETGKAAAVAAGDTAGEKTADAKLESSGETDEERQKREEAEEEERLIAEMEAAEREEEERERAFQEKRNREKEEAKKREAAAAANADEEMKRQEREAEARELEREREREAEKKGEDDGEAKALFASLKKPSLGPGATATEDDDDASEAPGTPAEESPAETAPRGAAKPKPAHLKLETNRKVEPAEPTPGMQALKSARFLELKEDALYPQGIQSPNPALNGSRKGRAYDKEFLLQFQNVFKEKPSVDWDQKVRDTLGPGDEPGSARPQSARTPSGAQGRSASQRGGTAASFGGTPMGTFGNAQGRTLPVGTTSQERFLASSRGMGMPGQMGRMPSNLAMGVPGMGLNRTNSSLAMGPNSPRQPSSRGGKGASKRGDNRAPSKKEEAEMAARMPLTAGAEVKALEKSSSGWKATSLVAGPMANAPSLDGHMDPELVQRKVKAALNKMTPEKFDKISDQILDIASQSKNESDGRTLRQVIQLTFEKACDEAHWAGMYAQFCHKMLTAMSTEIRDDTIKDKAGNAVVGGALFRKYLLNRCQEEFERGWQANLPDKPEGETAEAALLSDEYYIAAAAKRRGLGLIQFIGQLYKLNMLTGRIMHECVMRLLNFEGVPDEAAIENLTTLLKSVGSTMDADPATHNLVDSYFQRIKDKLLDDESLPSRPRFMVMDLVDLRKAGWSGKGDSKGPKTIAEIHQEAEIAQAKAEAERQRSRAGARPTGGRQDSRNFSGQMPPPVDYSRTNVSTDDLRRLQARGGSGRSAGGNLGPGGSLGPSSLGARAGSRRGLGPPGSGNSTRTSTPPVTEKKEEPAAMQNSFSALEALETEDAEPVEASRERSKSPLPAAEES